MTNQHKNYLLSNVAALATTIALGGFSSVAAQDGTAEDEQTFTIEEVIVTARKTEESLFEVPVAVSVLGGAFFEDTNFNTIEDVVRFVPGFDLTPLNTTRATGSRIRGISTFSFSDGFESSVATVVDGVVMGREAQGFFDLFDVESIEIVKGPQGTLFGKNASAGVVNVRTKLPEFEFGGGADFTYGSFDEIKARGTITGPLIEDKAAFRLSATYNKHDGILENAIEGERDLNDKDTFSFRGKLLFTPGPNTQILIAADYVEEENLCCLPTFRTIGAPLGLEALGAATGQTLLDLGPALDALGIEPGPNNRMIPVLDENILQESQAYGGSIQINHDFGSTQFTSITAYREWEIDEFNEADGISGSNVNNRNGTVSSSDQFSQEFRLDGTFGDQFSYVGGLFYFHQDLIAEGEVNIELFFPVPGSFFNVRTDSDRTVVNNSYAAFGEFTYDATEKLSLVGGFRLTREEIDATYERIATPINPFLPFTAFFGPDYVGATEVRDTNLSGRVIARYTWSDELMTYISWSRGYKGPGIDVAATVNIPSVNEPGGLPVLPPEIPTLWEVGMRGRFFDNRLSVNASAYVQKVEDLQTIVTDAVGVTRNLSIDELQSKGIEVDAVFVPEFIDGLTLTGTFNFNDVEIESFPERPDLEGIRFRDNPRLSYSMIGDYRRDVTADGAKGFLRAEWAWQSSKNTSLDRLPTTIVDEYGLLNLRIGVSNPEDTLALTFSVENVFNKDFEHFVFASSYSALDGITNAQFIGDPRLWAITLRATF
ncbi:MAG: TonB-dependent receptor [Kordiimonadaceae bacterium]|nr:TonB-dependent receptor [Kordiimonadaceae bacterium]MBO6569339.1 TonB-dependent receptor [Kordiimonadaceae bacterium]MBO6964814.1 TonB-dependent receptor [Kordiimonadaceae bacterium]